MGRKKGSGGMDLERKVAELAALRKVQGDAPVGRFVAALRDADLAVAKTATMGLCDRGAIVGPLRELLADADPAIRWRACALAWFFMIRDFVPDLIGALRDPDRMVRAEAAWAMRCADSAAVEALLRATRDPDRMVAHYAAWILRRIIRPKYPRLAALKGARIPECPLRPEKRSERIRRPEGVDDDARAFAQFACSTRLPAYRAPLVATPGQGACPPGAWRGAAAASLIHIDGYPEAPLRQTHFRVVSTPEALHFSIRCRYRDRRELVSRQTEHGSPVYTDNSVEVFLDPTGTGSPRYFQICLNTRNVRCYLRADGGVGHTWRPAAGGARPPWQPKAIRSAVRVERDCWVAELTVPFADLRLRRGRINKLWRMNVVRNARLPELNETTSWCDMGDYDAHRPERFGYLWVDAGKVVNADAGIFRAEPVPLLPGLPGWTVLRGDFAVREGEVFPLRGGGALRWDEPIPSDEFELSAQAQIRHQVRFLFSPDRANAEPSFMAAFINLINEINVAGQRRWEHWAPKYPGHLGIFKEVYPRLTHSRWYDLAVRVRPDRVQCLLDGAVQMELPNPRPEVRFIGLGFAGGGRLRKLRLRLLE